MKEQILRVLFVMAAGMGSRCALGAEYVVYDDFTWPSTTLDRARWWRGGIAAVDRGGVILNESDLTSSAMFLHGDFKFVIGGPSASSQGLFGLGDIDDGDPYLILKNSGTGWHFHVRSGTTVHTGPVVAPELVKGDVVVFYWDAKGARVSINGVTKDSQTSVHPPRMPLTLLEWNDSSKTGQIVMDSVSYSTTTVVSTQPATRPCTAPGDTMELSAKLVDDAFVDSSNPDTYCDAAANQLYIRNRRYHPDLTGAGKTIDAGHLALVQFALPPLPAGRKVIGARLAGVVAQNHKLYGMPGWAPGRPIELEVLGLGTNPDLTKVTYNALRDAKGDGVITDYTSCGNVNFTFGRQAQSLEVLRLHTSSIRVGDVVQFPDQASKLREFVQSRINKDGPTTITLAIGPGQTQAVSGMECDFKFHARKNTAGRAPMSLTIELNKEP
ncbi:MAG: hypothetical protein GX575_18010 [Candidatus Anammoximicrobium sp.]|nr:hypothetical protein [Candidatus Anammoximicrobium sp.]